MRTPDNDSIREDNPLGRKMKIKKAKKSFEYLCDALTELNMVFSFPVFLSLMARVFLSSFALYVSVYGIMSDNEFLKRVLPQTTTVCFVGCANIFIVLRSADLPINQVRMSYILYVSVTVNCDYK